MKRKLLTLFMMVLVAEMGTLQTFAQNKRKSFEEFRQSIKSDFNEFRRTLLDRYADFLEGEWHEYESLNGQKKYGRPKPATVPSVKPEGREKVGSEKHDVPPPSVERPIYVSESVGEDGGKIPSGNNSDNIPGNMQGNISEEMPRNPDMDRFSFFGLPMQLPAVEYKLTDKLYTGSDYARQWKELDGEKVADRILPAIRKVVKEIGLNDWLTYKLIESYIDSKFADSDVSVRLSAQHYLLASLGYDARIATTDSGEPILLIPTEQTIYARQYMMLDGVKYYVFGPAVGEDGNLSSGQVRTCRLPEGISKGRRLNLRLGGLNLPMRAKEFDLTCGEIHLKGEVNENLMPILYRYPQMPVGDFAASNLQPELRESLVNQLRTQLKGLDSDRASAELLKFMHGAFSYATDEENHGFEKPYFLEENLYYKNNDCEDRAIFYTWFLWNALGKEAQLVSFPGHEAATVCLDTPTAGTAYSYEGKTFYISDPTYIGSNTGQIMPDYRNVSPTVDYVYGSDSGR